MARQAKRNKTKRWGLRFGVGIPLAILVLIGLSWLVSRKDDNTATVATTTLTTGATATTLVGDTTTSAASTLPLPSTTLPEYGPTTTINGTTPCPPADGSSGKVGVFGKPPVPCIDAAKTYTAKIVTNKGELTVMLDQKKAPLTVNNFVVLARYHYFDNTDCHRIIPNFVVQCGDPTATGNGGPGYVIADELPKAGDYKVGSLAMANSGPGTNGSQFFIITGSDGAALPANYSLFGTVTEGLDTTVKTLDAAGNPDKNAGGVPPLEQVIIQSVTITES